MSVRHYDASQRYKGHPGRRSCRTAEHARGALAAYISGQFRGHVQGGRAPAKLRKSSEQAEAAGLHGLKTPRELQRWRRVILQILPVALVNLSSSVCGASRLGGRQALGLLVAQPRQQGLRRCPPTPGPDSMPELTL